MVDACVSSADNYYIYVSSGYTSLKIFVKALTSLKINENSKSLRLINKNRNCDA